MRGDLVSRPIGEVLQRGGESGQGRREGVAGRLAGHERATASTSDTAPASGRAGRSRRRWSSSRRRWASSACGCACTTSIRIRTSTTSIPLMARGQVAALSRRAVPAREPAHPEAHEASGQRREHAGPHQGAGARSARTSRSARHSSPAFPARPKAEFAELLGVPRGSATRPRRLLRATRRSMARPRTRCPIPFRRNCAKSGRRASCKRRPRSAP